MLETQSTQWHWYSSVSEHGERNKERWLYECNCCSIVQSCLTLWPHGLQHTRLPCPSLSPRVCSNSCPLSWWCHPSISSSVATFFLLLPSISLSIRDFSNESVLHTRWPKYWSFSFSISPSNEYSGLISFRIDCLISLQSKGLSRVFSSTTVRKHWFFGTQPCLRSSSQVWVSGQY